MLIVITNGDTRNIPVEILEHKFPCGWSNILSARIPAGQAVRGGLGHVRAFAARLCGVVLKEGAQEVDAKATRGRRLEMIFQQPECARILRHLSGRGRATEEDLARSLSLDLTFVRWSLRLLQRHYLVMEVTAREDLRIGVRPPETRFCLSPEAQEDWGAQIDSQGQGDLPITGNSPEEKRPGVTGGWS